jgi:Nucleotidyl transferase AbiEii toxin, Type IV TA system
MESELHYNTTNQHLLSILKTLMAAKEFNAFRLVGGTALSLLRGHRESIDIDLFSDAPYLQKGKTLGDN